MAACTASRTKRPLLSNDHFRWTTVVVRQPETKAGSCTVEFMIRVVGRSGQIVYCFIVVVMLLFSLRYYFVVVVLFVVPFGSFSHVKIGSLSPRKASCDRVALSNINSFLA